MRDLNDMVIVITGASAGIGESLARLLHSRGARLVLAARRRDRLEQLNHILGGSHLVVEADVARQQDCESIVTQSIERFGRIDTLIANAGFGLYYSVDQTSPQSMRELFQTNVFGTTDLIHAAIPHMLKQEPRDGWRGQVMLVSSAAARRGVPYLGPYSATKAAQLSIAEAMRVELSPNRIAVTSIHPIMTRTDFGRVAETRSGIVLPDTARREITQPVEHVARRMCEAIRKPRPEVWPSGISRWMLSIGTLFPSLVDRAMATYRDRVERSNRTQNR